MKKEKVLVQCVVNGEEVAEYVDPRESLLDMLRNHLGLTSVKKGCEVGECGACTVIIDGETIDSCIYLAVWAEGKNIRTLEGLEKNGELTRIQEAFIEEGAIQCGFCTPGFVMSATVLLEQGKELTREEKCLEISAVVPDIRILSMQWKKLCMKIQKKLKKNKQLIQH